MQFSLFGAEAGDLMLADLDGVLLGGGHWVDTAHGARLSVVVADPWRVAALEDAFAALDVAEPRTTEPQTVEPRTAEPRTADRPPTDEPAPDGDLRELTNADGFVARTRITPALRPLEARWRRGAAIAPPDDLVLSAAGLRLWAVTSGVADDVGYVLRTPQVPDSAGPAGRLHRIAGALLARTGIAAVELSNRSQVGGRNVGGPGWRVTSARRLRRLAELIGPPPPGGEGQWPTLGTGVRGRTIERH